MHPYSHPSARRKESGRGCRTVIAMSSPNRHTHPLTLGKGCAETHMNVAERFLRDTVSGSLNLVREFDRIERRTPQQLRRNVSALGRVLRDSGITHDDSIVILSGSCIEAIEWILAALSVGATAVPLNWLSGAHHVAAIIGRIEPRVCVFDELPEPAILRALANHARLQVSLHEQRAALVPGCRTHASLLETAEENIEYADLPPHHRALVLFSSGSQGSPKGIVMSQDDVGMFFDYHDFVFAQYTDTADPVDAHAALVTAVPPFHLAGIAMCLQGLLNGRPTYLLRHFIPELFLRMTEMARCSFIMLVPSLYRLVLREPYLRQMDTSALRFCINGGEPCSVELARRVESAFGAPAVTGYSMSECMSGIGHWRKDLVGGAIPPTSCGKLLFGDTRLIDADGAEHPTTGELWVRNRTVRACYLDAAMNQARLRDGWFRTGDLFYRDAQGNYFHRGRADDMFIYNGKNIYPAEIESLLMRHSAVEATFATAVHDGDGRAYPAALVVSNRAATENELIEFTARNGPSHAIPRLVCFTDSLPQLGAGKVDRASAGRLLQSCFDTLHK